MGREISKWQLGTVLGAEKGRQGVLLIVGGTEVYAPFHGTRGKKTRFCQQPVRLDAHLSAGHAVEEVLLGSDSREEAAVDEAPRTGGGVTQEERGQGLAVEHEGGTTTLQLNLPQQARNLHAVHLQGTKKVFTKTFSS